MSICAYIECIAYLIAEVLYWEIKVIACMEPTLPIAAQVMLILVGMTSIGKQMPPEILVQMKLSNKSNFLYKVCIAYIPVICCLINKYFN